MWGGRPRLRRVSRPAGSRHTGPEVATIAGKGICMTIVLRPEHERTIAEAIQSGLEALRSEDEWLAQNKEAINRKIEHGIAQLDRGEGISGADLRARLGKRKAAWLAEQKPR